MSEFLTTKEIAVVTGLTTHQVLYNFKNGVWNFGRVMKRGTSNRTRIVCTVSELADRLGIERKEVIERLEKV